MVIKALQGAVLDTDNHKVRIVAVGDMAGESINLASVTLRSAPVELLGSGIGSLSGQDLKKFSTEILPEMFRLAADGKITIDTQNETLDNIQTAWNQEGEAGKRIVIFMEKFQ
jgi:hypothetical protein